MTFIRGQVVYLYLRELEDEGDPEHYLERFPAGTQAVVQSVTEGSHRGLDLEVEVTNDDGEIETFSVAPDEVEITYRGGLLMYGLQESVRELRLAELEDESRVPF